MLTASSSVALVKDKILPSASDHLQSVGQSLQSLGQSLQTFSQAMEKTTGKSLGKTLKQVRKIEGPVLDRISKVAREVKPEQVRAVAKGMSKRALPFARANPLLALGLLAGAGLLVGLVSFGAGTKTKTVVAAA